MSESINNDGYEIGGENVFADLGLKDPEERLAKAEMLVALRELIAEKGLTQSEVARLCGVDQPTISKALRGRLGSVTIGRLASWLTCLGRDVEISIKERPAGQEDSRGHLSVCTQRAFV